MSQNPNPSQLDPGQIIKRAFNGDEDRIRVETAATIVAGAVEVAISDTTDSIKIGNGSGVFAQVTGANALKVDASGSVGSSLDIGTEDGTTSGTQRVFVNNRRQQVLAAHDLAEAFTWADFGLSTERITSIVYTSATVGAFTVTKTLSYTFVSPSYRLDSISWTVT